MDEEFLDCSAVEDIKAVNKKDARFSYSCMF